MNLKKIFCWPPLLAGVGAAVTIIILGYITYESILSDTNYGLWFFASFGSTVVIVFGYPNNDFAQPKNIFFGHLLTSFVGVCFLTFFEVNFITIGLAVGISVHAYDCFKNYTSTCRRESYCCNAWWSFVSSF